MCGNWNDNPRSHFIDFLIHSQTANCNFELLRKAFKRNTLLFREILLREYKQYQTSRVVTFPFCVQIEFDNPRNLVLFSLCFNTCTSLFFLTLL